MARFFALFVIVGLAIGGTSIYSRYFQSHDVRPPFRVEKVTRNDLHITVHATGTIEPEETVDVGAQVVGRIAELGKDPRGVADLKSANSSIQYDPKFANKSVDYCSPVIKGMILAHIDPAVYQAQYDQANASLAQAQAHVLQAQAQVAQTDAEWERAQRLRELKIPSNSPTGDHIGSQGLPIVAISDADYVLAKANAESAKADLVAAKAAVLQQQANVALAKTNLDYTTIYSPIDGTIVRRSVNIGQTVVSSLNAPSLFLIARDLRRMQVWAAVNEADIASVKPGTKVHFGVDALPDDVFHGTVVQRRLNASMTQNVVIYTVVIDVDNSDLKLLPYLTADVYFEVDEKKNALLVPNSALRFRPSPDQVAVEPAGKNSGSSQKSSGHAHQHDEENTSSSNVARLWEVVPGTTKVRSVRVETGASDMAYTEITGGDLKEGDEIVVGEAHLEAANSDVTNPLGPPQFHRRRSQDKDKNES
ncbi:MAG TPA: efflux RND transporter periplasmic adaptor subunit [Lacipirellulaceae bacterium]|nr:efflux RND transporter periplasmic adaptor subunit [Lacipirellulaceae bacterium]